MDLTTFASFGPVPYPSADLPVTVTLYVDGQVVATAIATYQPPM